jgi:dienelactone hydrolase
MLLTLLLGVLLLATFALADDQPGDRLLAGYLRAETGALADRCLTGITTLDEWNARRPEYRRQLAEMFGLWPTPSRSDLHARVTRRTELEDVVIENVEFQSLPGLYVTGNLYLPRQREKPLPGILYVCGHGNVKIDGIRYGSKAHYQHHGAWLARNGYVCLVIDTLQLGEIEGTHHGTYDQGKWWWNARGYTPAGVEAWNGIRALDYLQSRPEVDGAKLGMTGRSGGGAYSWWVAALDERVQVAAPVAGITDLENHVVDGVVEGHCDCMYVVNRYRWDYPQIAALMAPRPLLIANTDKDRIYPLEGVVRLHAKVRRIYQLHNAADRLGLLITEGPHKDTQDLQVPVLRWFNRFLKGETPLVTNAATPVTTPETLRVWSTLPKDARNTTIDESFVPHAPPPTVPADAAAWARQRDAWLSALREDVFNGWPAGEGGNANQPLELKLAFEATRHGLRFRAFDFLSQRVGEFRLPLRLYVAERDGAGQDGPTTLHLLDEEGWRQWLARMTAGFAEELSAETTAPNSPAADNAGFERLRKAIAEENGFTAWVAPRGIGLTAWSGDERKRTHIRRRFMLLGLTLDGMRVWDARRAIQAVRSLPGTTGSPLVLHAERSMSGIALYASLFEPGIGRLDLTDLPASHREGPDFLNVLKHLDIPQAVAVAAERAPVRLRGKEAASWEYPRLVGKALAWGDARLELR